MLSTHLTKQCPDQSQGIVYNFAFIFSDSICSCWSVTSRGLSIVEARLVSCVVIGYSLM